jgi:hypothetical protein
MRVASAAAAGLLALLPMAAAADMPVTYKDKGRSLFAVNVPDFWSVRAGGSRELTAPGSGETRQVGRVLGLRPTAEGGLWMGFLSPEGIRTREQAMRYLREIGPFLLRDASVADQVEIRIGGRPAGRITGTGTRGGRSVNFTALTIDLPGNRVAISVVVMEAGVNPGLVDDVNAIYSSFRPVY